MNKKTDAPLSAAERFCFEREFASFLPLGIDLIGRYKCHRATPLLPHRHRCWEICHVARGSMSYEYDGMRVDIPAGNVHLCPPEFEHTGFNRKLTPCVLYWLEVDPAQLLGQDWGFAIFQDPVPLRFPIPGNLFAEAVETMLLETANRATGWQQMVTARMQMLLIWLGRVTELEAQHRPGSPGVRRIVASLNADLAGTKSWAEHLQAGGRCKSLLYRKFREETGFSPQEYRRKRVVEAAQELLLNRNLSVTEIACRLGFSTSQYFSTVFRRETGFAPREWRERMHVAN